MQLFSVLPVVSVRYTVKPSLQCTRVYLTVQLDLLATFSALEELPTRQRVISL